MAVPWINNPKVKYQKKNDKYRNVLNELKLDYPNYEMNQLTFTIDVLGGHSKHLRENISEIIKDKARIKSIVYHVICQVFNNQSESSNRCAQLPISVVRNFLTST